MAENTSSKVFKSDLDRPSLLTVRRKYGDLQDLIGSLSRKVSDVASNAENEFLSAYRVHMLSIQSELKELNEQVAKAEEQLNDDGHVAKLEHEVSWFRDESSRLKTNTDSMNKDLEAMKVRYKALKEQKLFLSEQLKSVMKRSRVLESEIQLNGNDHLSVGSASTISQQRMRRSPAPRVPSRVVSKTLRKASSDSKFTMNAQSGPTMSKDSDGLLCTTKKPQPGLGHKSHQEALRNLIDSRGEVEMALEDAIKEIFRDIVMRKIAVTAQNSISRSDSQIPPREIEQRLTQESMTSGPGGVTGLGLEHFTEIDRLEAIVHFLSVPRNFELVVKALLDF